MFEGNRLDLTEENFSAIYKEYYASLTRMAVFRVRNLMVAEDIVTDIYIRLWSRNAEFDTIRSVIAFLKASVHNACINHMQQFRRHRQIEEIIKLEKQISENSIMHRIIHFEMQKQVSSLLQVLPKQCQTIMRLYYYNEKDHPEIADIMGLSVHTIRNQIVRGIILLRQRYRVSSQIEEYAVVNGDVMRQGNSVLATVLNCNENQDIAGLVDDLPLSCRKVIKLLFYKKCSISDITLLLNISEKTVQNRKRQGIYLMMQELKIRSGACVRRKTIIAPELEKIVELF